MSWLSSGVYYDNLDYPISLKDSTQIKLTVEQPENAPAIILDSNGMIHGLRTGKAKIIADYDGVQDTVVVNVYTQDGAPVIYRSAQAGKDR
jgi:hypothetical protein